MKIKKGFILLMTFFILLILTACGLQNIDDVPEEVVDAVEDMHDDVKENIKNNINTTDNNNQTVQPTTDTAKNISAEEALDIALKHAGFTKEQVDRIRTEYEIDDRVPEYEIQYYYENMEYDYTIHAETGDIISYDWDND